MAAAAGALRDGAATAEDVARLDRWSVVLRGRGAPARRSTAPPTSRRACSNASRNSSSSTSPALRDLPRRHLQRPTSVRGGGVPIMSDHLRIRLDRTICDGFGACAPARTGLLLPGRLGYAALIGDGTVPDGDRPAVLRALFDCPVHAIVEVTDDSSPVRAGPNPLLPTRNRCSRSAGASPSEHRRDSRTAAATHRGDRVLLDVGRRRHLRIQECRGCSALIHPPQPVCRYCGGHDLGPRAVSGSRCCRRSPSTTGSPSPAWLRPTSSPRSRSGRTAGPVDHQHRRCRS